MAHARLIQWIAVAVVATGCGTAPTAPVTPVVETGSAGSWRGVLAITSCTGGTSGSCSTAPEAFVLRLQADGRGVLQIDTKVWDSAPAMAVDVAAAPGAPLVVTPVMPGGVLDARLVLTTVTADTLAGVIRYSINRSTTVQKEGHVLFAERDRTTYGSRFQGEWLGFVARTQCEGDCTADDDVVNFGSVRFALSQTGGRVTGVLNGHPLEGTGDGDRLTLSARMVLEPSRCKAGWDSGTLCLVDISVSGRADALDRMTGTVTYRVEGVDYRNRPFAYSATADLAGVTRWR